MSLTSSSANRATFLKSKYYGLEARPKTRLGQGYIGSALMFTLGGNSTGKTVKKTSKSELRAVKRYTLAALRQNPAESTAGDAGASQVLQRTTRTQTRTRTMSCAHLIERVLQRRQLVQHAPKAPHVAAPVVWQAADHLRGHVVGRAHRGAHVRRLGAACGDEKKKPGAP